jgi:hypothetical protein
MSGRVRSVVAGVLVLIYISIYRALGATGVILPLGTSDPGNSVFRRAKAKAAEHRMPLRQFISEAVAEKLEAESRVGVKTRLALAGKLRHLRKETARINSFIEREFEKVEPEEWA